MMNARSAAPFLVGLLVLGAGAARAASEGQLEPSDVAARQLQQLRALSQALAQQQGRPARADRIPGEAVWLSSLEDQLGRELLLLETFAVTNTAGVPPGALPDGHVLRIEMPAPGDRSDTLELPVGRFETLALRLENRGHDDVVEPILIVNGRDWSDIDALLADAVGTSESDAAVTESLWAFVVRNRRHDQPAHEGLECHDPIRMFNIYGYGLCDDSANVLANLARRAGFEARVWALGGHVVCELQYDDAWHMFDADHEVLYRNATGGAASLAELLEDPTLLDEPVRVAGRAEYPLNARRFEAQIASVDDNSYGAYRVPKTWHDMGFTLRPGERVTLHRGHWGRRFAAGRPRAPHDYANGVWEDHWPAHADTGAALRRYELPWPVVGGVLRVSGVGAATARDWELAVRAHDGTSRGTLAPAWRAGSVEFDIDLALQLGSGDPDYALELSLSGPGLHDPGVVVETQLVFQHAPLALPRLHAGSNSVRLTSRSGDKVRATLVYAND